MSPLPAVLLNATKYWGPAAAPPVGLLSRVPTLTSSADPPSCQLLCYQPVRQCQNYWCWAAVFQELLRCLAGQSVSQCEIVQGVFTEKDCNCTRNTKCDPAVKSPCNNTEALEDLVELRWQYQMINAGDLSVSALCCALARERPVIARFSEGSENHYAVISGIVMDATLYLEISDPYLGREVQVAFQPGQLVKYGNWGLNAVFFI